MLISECARSLNSELHETNPIYGTSGAGNADLVVAVAHSIDTRSILDYGCGKRTLETALGMAIANYDPAIRGLDTPPKPADLVVCTDVLEHVEPECVRAVLEHLRSLTKRVAFLAIACGPAAKFLSDGRNAHLTQHPLEWWLPKLEGCWRTVRYWSTPNGFYYIGQSLSDKEKAPNLDHIGPPPTTKIVKTKSCYTDEQRMDNVRSSMLRGLRTVPVIPAHDETFILACYGPSLSESIEEIRQQQGDVYSVSGAHPLLIENGIIPKGHIEADPRPHKAKLIGTPHKDVVYFLASACNRVVYNLLHGYETWMFHQTASDAETELIASMDASAFTVDGGTHVGMSAVALGTVLGYRKFEIFGMDCSFRCDPELLHWPNDKEMSEDMRSRVQFHAGAHPNEDQPVYRVWVDDKPFITSPQMMQGAQDAALMFDKPNCIFNLHGDGFLRALLAEIRKRKQQKRDGGMDGRSQRVA